MIAAARPEEGGGRHPALHSCITAAAFITFYQVSEIDTKICHHLVIGLQSFSQQRSSVGLTVISNQSSEIIRTHQLYTAVARLFFSFCGYSGKKESI